MYWLTFASLTGCVTLSQHRSLEDRLAVVETEFNALQDRLEPLLPATPEEEQKSRELLETAMTATQEMRWDDAKAALEELMASHPKTQAAQIGQSLSEEVNVVGRDAVALQVDQWFQGSAEDLADDKATLYVFWEAWCPHCRREVPKLSGTYDRFREKGLGMVGLTEMTRDVTPEDVGTFISETGVSYPIVKEKESALARQYGIRGIPAAAMVKDGKVVWRGHPASLTDDLIEKVLLP